MRFANLLMGIIGAWAVYASGAYAAFNVSFEVSSEMGNRLAAEEFPLTLKLEPERLFVTQPVLIFMDEKRLGISVRFQAYDHRPAENIAISESGDARFSGELDFDSVAHRILLHNPKLDSLQFDRNTPEAMRLAEKIQAAWKAQVSNPLQADIPPHPYVAPFKENIRDISYDGKAITLHIGYE